MSESTTKPTDVPVETFLHTTSDKRRLESRQLIEMMQHIIGTPPLMWGPSIIGFGQQHYEYKTGNKGDMPLLAFSPRKTAITVYFMEGFDRYGAFLQKLGTYKTSLSCLYIKSLADIDVTILRQMIEASYRLMVAPKQELQGVSDYIDTIPPATRPQFDRLRELVRSKLPEAEEVISYGIIGYKIDSKRPRVFISGWRDHVAMYPVPHDTDLTDALGPFVKGKGTLWFSLDGPLPDQLIKKTVQALVKA